MTQVLFFKFTHEEARMFKRGALFSISSSTLEQLAPKIRDRVIAFAEGNIGRYELN
jgi:hypothetical protein